MVEIENAQGRENMKDEEDKTAAHVLRVAVGSSNPAKIRAVEQALQHAFKKEHMTLNVQGFSVESNVSDQPFGDSETLQGSKNRAQAAYNAYREANQVVPHISVGLEGGLEWMNNSTGDRDVLYCMAWMAVYGKREPRTVEAFASSNTVSYPGDKGPVFGLAKTAIFPVPDEVGALVREGVELGDADDRVFHRVKSKHGDGLVGLLTDGLIDRSGYYQHALTLALLPWMRPDLYPLGN